ncbi:MAG: hypothetical protein VXW65_05375 [Pseudomonadota bacterium]|nr:hypothetical protein [Pseudomonadota bacterium]
MKFNFGLFRRSIWFGMQSGSWALVIILISQIIFDGRIVSTPSTFILQVITLWSIFTLIYAAGYKDIEAHQRKRLGCDCQDKIPTPIPNSASTQKPEKME